MAHGDGDFGLSVDQAKCVDLLREAVDLGYPPAQYQLGSFHDTGEMGLKRNEKEALKYYEKAAEGGFVIAQHNLACTEWENGDRVFFNAPRAIVCFIGIQAVH